MEFIKFMWRDFIVAQKIALAGMMGTLGICVYGVTQHPIWWLTLSANIMLLWAFVYAEWCLYKIKKLMGGWEDKHEH